MTTEEKKIDLIGKIVKLESDELIDMVNELLRGNTQEVSSRKPGWGKGMIHHISDDFNDFIPPEFPS
ncbi:hypothetical protein [Dyadobacter sp. CY323]|uniref:hypothetical protein n=1 Tax=Dyadobacter sp. CY323 TaxID=2907302 RepID=UPI001F3D7141|nr:hypothetical protein [Dyadobacter sp. CY323]MCE6991529.1 hypothetical protein [Dyadobacter sp. CY323]